MEMNIAMLVFQEVSGLFWNDTPSYLCLAGLSRAWKEWRSSRPSEGPRMCLGFFVGGWGGWGGYG